MTALWTIEHPMYSSLPTKIVWLTKLGYGMTHQFRVFDVNILKGITILHSITGSMVCQITHMVWSTALTTTTTTMTAQNQ
jgi:hypothetical protein